MKYIGWILGVVMFGQACCAGEIVAVVNDAPISRFDVVAQEALLKLQNPDGAAQPDAYRRRLAEEDLIDTMVKMQTASEAGIAVTDADLQKARAYLETQNAGAGNLSRALADNAIPERVLDMRIRADLAWGEYVRRQNAQTIVADAEVENRKILLKRLHPEAEQQVPVWELAQAVLPPSSRALAGAQGLPMAAGCDGFMKRVSPEAVAGSVRRGLVAPDQLPDELKRLLAPAQVETVAGPVQTPAGQLFLMKCAVMEKSLMPADDEIRQQIMMERLGKLSDQLLKEARRQAVIERKG